MFAKTALLASAAALLLAPTSAFSSSNSSPTNATLRALTAEAGSCCQFVKNVDIIGSDLKAQTEGDKTKCCGYCLGNPSCQALTWTDYNGGTCWLKTSFAGSATVKIGAVTVLSSCTPTYVKLNNCDMPGNDLKDVKKTSPNDCFGECKATPNCYGYTWSDYNGGTCFLKSAVAPCVSAGNKFSGAMGQGGLLVPIQSMHKFALTSMTDTSGGAGGSATRRRRIARMLSEKLGRRLSLRALRERGIRRDDGASWRCSQVGTSAETEWFWTRTGDASGFTSGGLHFSIEVAPNGDLVACGVPQPVTLEQLLPQRAASKFPAANLCHSPKASQLRVRGSDQPIVASSSTTSSFPVRSSLLLARTQSVRQIACGVSHCIALCKLEGGPLQLHAWGIGHYGQLGLGEDTKVSTTMTPITASTELLSVLCANSDRTHAIRLVCGPLSSCLTITDAVSSSVWLWGLLPTLTQNREAFIEQAVPSCKRISSCSFRLRDVSVGLAYVVLLSEAGEVFTWGHNTAGQLGIGLQHKFTRGIVDEHPVRVDFHDPSIRIDSVSCGYEHTLAVTRDGTRVFAWGCNRLGACGATTKFFEYSHPVVVADVANSQERVVSISCKAHTSVAAVRSPDGQRIRLVLWGVSSTRTARLCPVEARTTVGLDGSRPIVSAGYGEIQLQSDIDDPTSAGDSMALNQVQTKEEASPCLTSAPSPPPSVTVMAMSIVASRGLHAGPPLRDLQWTRPSLHRVRVFASDIVVLLVESANVELSSVVVTTRQEMVESGEQRQNPAIYTERLPVQHASLHLLVIRLERVGAFEVHIKSDEREDDSTQIMILSIDCCEHPSVRAELLLDRRDWIWQCFAQAKSESGTRVRQEVGHQQLFANFLGRVAQDTLVAKAIAHSPMAVPLDKAVSWDLDRCALEKAAALAEYVRRSRSPSLPLAFASWVASLEPIADEEDGDQDVFTRCYDYLLEGVSLRELLAFSSADGGEEYNSDVSEVIYLAIGNIPVTHVMQEDNFRAEDPKATMTKYDFVRSPVLLVVPSPLCVPQSALDFLVHGSQTHLATAEQDRNLRDREGNPLGIRMWRDERGDAFYSTARSAVSLAEIYQPDEREDSMRRTKVRRLQRELHAFLWAVLDARPTSIHDLYSRLGAISDSTRLQSQLQHMGFHADHVHRETWFSLFRVLQRLVDDKEQHDRRHLNLHTLRVFLVDPYHDIFWQHYITSWLEALARSSHRPRPIGDLLVDAFPSREQHRLPWETFAFGLRRLHEQLNWPLDDQVLCRLLYHFDVEGNGHIALQNFGQSLVQAASTRNGQRTKKFDQDSGCLGRSRLQRPDVNMFSTPVAVRKLYHSRSVEPRGLPSRGDATPSCDLDETEQLASQLMRVGNSRLARIRNLPVSRMLSEGIAFRSRPTRRQRERYAVASNYTDADPYSPPSP